MYCYHCMEEVKTEKEVCPICDNKILDDIGEDYYLRPGTLLLGRYQVGHVLGNGSFGITYVAQDLKEKQKVAIKEYFPKGYAIRKIGSIVVKRVEDGNIEEYEYGKLRFLDEARRLSRYSQNANVVSVHNYFEENNTAYVVMEHLAGVSLSKYLEQKGGRISFEESLSIMKPVMEVLEIIHKDKNIHSDIRPENIFITKEDRVKLIDFGFARYSFGERCNKLASFVKGGYTAPEQYSTTKINGPWSDIYCCAASIYRMVYGEELLEGDQRMDNPEIQFDHSLTKEVKYVLAKALSVDPEKRYHHIEQFAKNLMIPSEIEVDDEDLMIIEGKEVDLNKKTQVKTRIYTGIGLMFVCACIVLFVGYMNRPNGDKGRAITYSISSDEVINYNNAISIKPSHDLFVGKGNFGLSYVDKEQLNFITEDGYVFVTEPIKVVENYQKNIDRHSEKSNFLVTLSYGETFEDERIAVAVTFGNEYKILLGDKNLEENKVTVGLDSLHTFAVVELNENYEILRDYPIYEGMDEEFFDRDASVWSFELLQMDIDEMMALASPLEKSDDEIKFNGFSISLNSRLQPEYMSISGPYVFGGNVIGELKSSEVYEDIVQVATDYNEAGDQVVEIYQPNIGVDVIMSYDSPNKNINSIGELLLVEIAIDPLRGQVTYEGFRPENLGEGDVIGDFTVTFAGDYLGTSENEPEYTYSFEGTAIIRGHYNLVEEESGLDGEYFYLSVTKELLPYGYTDKSHPEIFIDSYDVIKEAVGDSKSGVITLVIDKYDYYYNTPSPINSSIHVTEVKSIVPDQLTDEELKDYLVLKGQKFYASRSEFFKKDARDWALELFAYDIYEIKDLANDLQDISIEENGDRTYRFDGFYVKIPEGGYKPYSVVVLQEGTVFNEFLIGYNAETVIKTLGAPNRIVNYEKESSDLTVYNYTIYEGFDERYYFDLKESLDKTSSLPNKLVAVEFKKEISDTMFEANGEYEVESDIYLSLSDIEFELYASSTLLEVISGNARVYTSLNMFDNDRTTIWAEGNSGNGDGEWIEIKSDVAYDLKEIKMSNGFIKSEKDYYRNNRFTKLTIETDQGDKETFNLTDGMIDLQTIKVEFESVKALKLTFSGIKSGSKYNDLCISELMINGQYIHGEVIDENIIDIRD